MALKVKDWRCIVHKFTPVLNICGKFIPKGIFVYFPLIFNF